MVHSILKYHTFFPFVKYQKDKTTKMIDTSKPPLHWTKVPIYNDVWRVGIYDTKQTRHFLDESFVFTLIDLISKQSYTTCVLQCDGTWIGGWWQRLESCLNKLIFSCDALILFHHRIVSSFFTIGLYYSVIQILHSSDPAWLWSFL